MAQYNKKIDFKRIKYYIAVALYIISVISLACVLLHEIHIYTPSNSKLLIPLNMTLFLLVLSLVVFAASGIRNLWDYFTEMKETEKLKVLLGQSENIYRATLDSMDVPIHVVDRNLNIVFFNRSFKEWNQRLGIEDKVENKNLKIVFPFISEHTWDDYQAVLKNGKIYRTEETIELNGMIVRTEIKKIPIFEEGIVSKVITIVHDVTTERQLEVEKDIHRRFSLQLLSVKNIRDLAVILSRESLTLFHYNNYSFYLYHDDSQLLEGVYSEDTPEGSDHPIEGETEPILNSKELVQHLFTGQAKLFNQLNRDNPFSRIIKEGNQNINGSLICAPIQWNNQIVAVIFVFSKNPNQYSEKDFFTFQTLVNQSTDTLSRILTESQVRKTNIDLEKKIAERTNALSKANMTLVKEITERKNIEQVLRDKQRQLVTLVANFPGIVYRYRRDERYTLEFMSEGCLALLGYSPEELIEKRKQGYMDMVYPEDRDMIRQRVEEAIREEKSFEITYRMNTFFGELKWVWEKGRGVQNDSGRVDTVEGFIMDITRNRDHEEILCSTIEKYKNLVENVNDAVWEVDAQGVFTYISPQWEMIFGYKTEEVIGKTPFDFIDPNHVDEIHRKYNEYVSRQEPFVLLENTIIHREGNPVYVETSGKPVFDLRGNLTGYRGINRDISERKRSSFMLEAMNLTIQQQSRTLKDIITAFNDPTILIDPSGNVIYANTFTNQFINIEWHEGQIFNIKDLPFSREFIDKLMNQLQQVIKTSKAIKGESSFLTEAGVIWFEYMISPVIHNNEEIVNILITTHDVTQRVKFEKELQQALREKNDLEQFVKHSPAVVFLCKSESGYPVEYVSQNINQYGYDAQDMISGITSWVDLLEEKEQQFIRNQVDRLSRREVDNFSTELSVKTRDGRMRWCRLTCWIRENAEGQITHYQGLLKDITEKKETREALRKMEEWYRNLAENANDFIFIVDTQFKVEYINRFGLDYLHCTLEAVLGKSIEQAFGATHVCEIRKKIQLVLDSRTSRKEVDHVWINDRDIVLETVLTPLMDHDNNVYGVLGISRDVSERVQNEEKVRQLNQELNIRVQDLNRANQELETLNFTISHDLRGPLQVVDGFLNMLKTKHSGDLKPDAKNFIEIMQRNTRRMDVLICELLDLSRLGRQEVHAERLNMKEMAKIVANDTMMISPTRKIELEIKEMSPANGDAGMINHVWMNLIGNAFKYTRNREIARIEIGGYEEHDRIVYYVKDNGAGFNMKEYGRLFRTFQRLHSISEFEGSGIGLAIVQRVIAKHKGEVWAESTLGEGATFYFSLPNLNYFQNKKE